MARPESDSDLALSAIEATGAVFDLEWTAAEVSGLVRTELDREEGVARAAVVLRPGDDQTVVIIAEELALPARSSALRGPGLWLELTEEVPLDHWTVGLEAFGVTVDADEPLTAETRGQMTPIGLDLDVETADPGPTREGGAVRIPVRVWGEVLIGPDRHEINGHGVRWRGGLDLPLDPESSGRRARLRLGGG